MVRVGMNPARGKVTAYSPARVTVAVLVYVPFTHGYFEHRFDVVRLSIDSVLKHTDLPYDLMVFDNGSCEQVKTYLRSLLESRLVRYLISSSENIGKRGALRVIAGAAPGELVAYADDDTFFYPGWLSAHVRVLEAFPNVGMVSGSPERTLFDHGIQSNLHLAETDPEVTLLYGRTIPEAWEHDWAVSLGRDPEGFLRMVRDLQDIRIERRGVIAYATACHNQFLAPRAVLTRFLEGEWSGRLMGEMNELDDAIDAAGYLRLTTVERTTRLTGNLISEALADEARRFSIPVDRVVKTSRRGGSQGWKGRVLTWKPVQKLLLGVYSRLFRWITQQETRWYVAEEDRGN